MRRLLEAVDRAAGPFIIVCLGIALLLAMASEMW